LGNVYIIMLQGINTRQGISLLPENFRQ
jgi:hypothetical protein